MTDIAELGYGLVRGRFLAGILDTADPGLAPDVIALQGYVEFTATAGAIRVVSASPAPVTVLPQKLTVQLDGDGYLAYNGSHDIALLATDDVDGNPVNWQWKVAFFLRTADNTPVTLRGFNFDLLAGTVADLTVVSPLLEPSPGTVIIKGPAGDAGSPIQMRTSGGYVQWKPTNVSTWTNLVALTDITGPPGAGSSGPTLPVGGTVGQMLRKNSTTDGDASWTTPTKATVGLGNVDNTTDALKPVSTAQQTALDAKASQASVDLKAPLASPVLTGAPTAPTPADADNTTRVATTAFVVSRIAALVAGSPGLLDTLNELATALGNDPNFAATMSTALGNRVLTSAVGQPNGVADLDNNGLLPDARLATATESTRGPVRIATATEAAAGTLDTRALTPLKLAGRIATTIDKDVVQGKIMEIAAFAAAVGRWPVPIKYNTGNNTWPLRSAVVPSWYTGPARWEALSTTNVTAPAGMVTGDVVVDLYAA